MAKVLVALSGGVDSSVAALLLKQQAHEVSAVYMRTWMEEGEAIFNCPWEEDIRFAREAAKGLGVPFEVVNFMEYYRERVVTYLLEGYRSGVTPNPDIMCNREIKFGALLQYALEQGFEYVATGHYCQKCPYPDGTADVLEGVDKNKDQSYFLCRLQQHQIQRALFPIGGLKKPEVRQIAKQNHLPNAARKDSQGICFLGKVPINLFLKNYISENPGDIITIDGCIVGQHRGLHYFTLGQRKGICVPSNADFEKYVVVGKDFEQNRLLIAFESDPGNGLYIKDIAVHELSFTRKELPERAVLLAKPRYRDPSQVINFRRTGPSTAQISFKDPQRALAKGQVLALYEGERLLGSGVYV